MTVPKISHCSKNKYDLLKTSRKFGKYVQVNKGLIHAIKQVLISIPLIIINNFLHYGFDQNTTIARLAS